MTRPALPDDAREAERGVVFFDLTRFAAWSRGRAHVEVAAFLQHFYEQAADAVAPQPIRLLKFMGDAGLGVFAPQDLRAALDALRDLRRRVRAFPDASAAGMDLVAKVHVGEVVTGTFGAGGAGGFDVMGPAVCEAALLPGPGLVLSDVAAARLEGSDRARLCRDEAASAWRED